MIYDEAHYEQLRGVCLSYRNDAERLQQENEQLKQQLAEKDKQLENAIVPKFKVGDVLWYIRCDKVEKFIVYEARCDCVFYYVNEDGVDVDEYKLFATKQEAEEALKKLNKE